jgi:hypothetical protein
MSNNALIVVFFLGQNFAKCQPEKYMILSYAKGYFMKKMTQIFQIFMITSSR